MDRYVEISVTKQLTLKDRFVSMLISVLPMLVGVYLVVLVLSSKATTLLPFAIIICVLLCWLSFKVYSWFNIDWEYTLVDDELRFAKIINKSKRRELITVRLPQTEVLAKISDSNHNNILKRTDIRKYKYISQTTNDYYFINSFDTKGNRVCVYFEPDEKMRECLKYILRSKFLNETV